MRAATGQVKLSVGNNPCLSNNLTGRFFGRRIRAILVVGRLGHLLANTSTRGGETVSTGVRGRWMHAERHRLVKPVGQT